MIGQNSNNKATGYTAKECDAGIPISGRTGDTGTYEIIKTLADGTLAGFPSPITNGSLMLSTPTFSGSPGAGPFAANTFIANGASLTITESGIYRLNPVILIDGPPGSSVNIALYNPASSLGTYIAGLIPGNAFNPTAADLATGLAYYQHNNGLVNFGTTFSSTFNRNNSFELYLTPGVYLIAIISDGGLTFTGPSIFSGFYEITKI